MEKVCLLRHDSYDVDALEKKLREGFEILGGDAYLRKLIPTGSKVLLKPNLLSMVEKGSPVITHFAMFEAVIRIVSEYSNDISFGDSPGSSDARKAAEKGGLIEVADRYGVKFADFSDEVHVELNDPIMFRYWDVARAPYEADVVISLPKLKTHAMMYYTGAVKNQFGCLYGAQKAGWHTKQPDPMNFARMLLDLNSLVGTSFAILDGIMAMEGNGPRNGTPKRLDSIIMGEDLAAIDSVAVRLIGYDKVLNVPFLKAAHEAHWGKVMPEDIDVLGETIDSLKSNDFKLSRSAGAVNFLSPKLNNLIGTLTAPDPVVIEDKCISCKMCDEVCPRRPDVITFAESKGKMVPRWDYSKCIRCFCCQELCPKGAIVTRRKLLGKIFRVG